MGNVAFHRGVGYTLILTVLALVAMGLVMLYSIGTKDALEGQAAVLGAMQRQLIWFLIGAIVAVIFFGIDPHRILEASPWLCAIGFLLLVACYIPGIGKEVNGARRWIEIGQFTLQPSEWAKFAFLSYLAHRGHLKLGNGEPLTFKAIWPVFVILMVYAGLILLTPDLGTAAIFGVLFVIGLFIMGLSWLYTAIIPTFGLAAFVALAIAMPERRGRILAFLDPEAHRLGDAWQVWQAHIALGSGGLYGLGLGNSRQKMDYLPEANTDFIFAIIGEELGLWVCLTVVLAYALWVLCGAWISYYAPDFGTRLLAFGMTTAVGLQALINLGVVTALLPNKGLPLPFISYGGSNLVFSLAAVGVLLSIHQRCILRQRGLRAVLARSGV
jgi:cell division protein FtsW